jgi:hypothetical protein
MTLRMRLASEAKAPGTKRLVEDLAEARRRLSNLIVSGPGNDATDEYRSSLEKGSPGQRASRTSSGEGKLHIFPRTGAREIGLGDVVASLPSGSALVAYASAGEGKNRSYVAFVKMAGRKDPFFVPIASASRLEATVSGWLTATNEVGAEPVQESSQREPGLG